MPRNRRIPPWNNRANITYSKNNHAYHTQYKEYFDKRCGSHQYTDNIKYIYKTPSNGARDHAFFDKKAKYYWERRQPIDPDSVDKYQAEEIEAAFRHDFQVMSSKNNEDRPRAEREYFDRPINYMHQGFMFSPVHRRPIELLGESRMAKTNPNGFGMGGMNNTFSGSSKSFGGGSMMMHDLNNNIVVPITNGMSNEQLFNKLNRKPKDLSRKGAELSVDYGQIPFLRSGDRRNKKHRRARTMTRQFL